ncbi:MAG TPA: hypothetical protein V6C69_15235 [Trichormus sp.]
MAGPTDQAVTRVVQDAHDHKDMHALQKDLVLLAHLEPSNAAYQRDLQRIGASVDLKTLGLDQFALHLPVGEAKNQHAAGAMREALPETAAAPPATATTEAFRHADRPGWMSAIGGKAAADHLLDIHNPADAALHLVQHPEHADEVMQTLNTSLAREKYMVGIAWATMHASAGGTLSKTEVQKLSSSGNKGEQAMAAYLLSSAIDGSDRTIFDTMSDVDATRGTYSSVSLAHLQDIYQQGLNQQLRH